MDQSEIFWLANLWDQDQFQITRCLMHSEYGIRKGQGMRPTFSRIEPAISQLISPWLQDSSQQTQIQQPSSKSKQEQQAAIADPGGSVSYALRK